MSGKAGSENGVGYGVKGCQEVEKDQDGSRRGVEVGVRIHLFLEKKSRDLVVQGGRGIGDGEGTE